MRNVYLVFGILFCLSFLTPVFGNINFEDRHVYECNVTLVMEKAPAPDFVNKTILPLYNGSKKIVAHVENVYDADTKQEYERVTVDIISSPDARLTDCEATKLNKDSGVFYIRAEKHLASGEKTVFVGNLSQCKESSL